jgi:outer membrane protein TolC
MAVGSRPPRGRGAALLGLLLLLQPGLGMARPADDASLRILKERLERLGDRLEQTARRLTLQEAVMLGLQRQPRLARDYDQLQALQWQGIAIRREWSPTLLADNDDPGLVGWRRVRERDSSNDTLDGVSLTNNLRSSAYSVPRLTLDWTFFDPSRTPRLRSNLAGQQAQELLFDITARDLILDIQSRYYALQKLQELEQAYRSLYKLARTLADTAGGNEQLRTEELALVETRVRTHDALVRTAAQLAELLSLPPGEIALPAEPLQASGSWDLDRSATITEALALREEIRRSLAGADGLSWSARAVQSRYLPSLGLRGQLKSELENYSIQSLEAPSSTTSGGNGSVRLDGGLQLSWRLFDGGVLGAQATALRRQADLSLQQAALDRLTVTRQVESSHASYITSRILLDSTREQLRAARAALENSRRGNDATTQVQTIEKLRQALEAEAGAREQHNTALAELYRYSARWPEGAPTLVDQRRQELRQR